MPEATSPDRLPPGALLEGSEEAFGFPIPKGMILSRSNRRAFRAEGRVDFNDLTDYVKERIHVRHAEMFGSRLLFPNAKLRSGGDLLLEFAITQHRGQSILTIRNRTPLPATHGLSEKERWERAGFKFEGGRIDPKVLE